jgi:hypothetical protein
VWSVAVKVFVLAQQMIYRIFDFSAGALAEMIVRGEAERLKKRFGDLVILTGSTAAAVAVMLALCNHGFLQVWTHGRITWDSQNDLLMAVSFFVYSLTRLSIGLMGVTKRIGAMKFIYFIEGAAFAGLALWWAPRLGFAGVILSGILTNCLMSGIYGMRRAADYFHISVPELLRNWLNRPVLLFAISGMAALVLWLTTRDWNAPLQLAVNAALCGSMVLFLFWRLGVPERLRKEVAGRFFKRGRLAEV